jgi:hypothetical protein
MWFILYVLVAAWVGQGEFHLSQARSAAALGAVPWGLVGTIVIELSEAPKGLVKALMEARDD